MDFKEIKNINIENKTALGKQKREQKVNLQKSENTELKNIPNNPSYWQNAVGVNKLPSFKGVNFQNIHNLSDGPVDEAFFNETVKTLKDAANGYNSEEINYCLESAKKISGFGKRALYNYVDVVSSAFKNQYPAKRIIEMTNLIFDKVPKFSHYCTESLKNFLDEINCTDNEGYEFMKDCINAVLSDNTSDESKMAWISFHMPLSYEPYKEDASIVTDYLNNYPAYCDFINHFEFDFMKKDVSKLKLDKNQMQDLSYLMKKGELKPKTLSDFAHSNAYYEENELCNGAVLRVNASIIAKMICEDKEKLELFEKLVNIDPKTLCYKSTDMIKALKSDSKVCGQLIDDLKTRPDNPYNAQSFISLFEIINRNNLNVFLERTKGTSEREALDHAKTYINPKTKKYDASLADYSKYLIETFKMQFHEAVAISRECVDMKTGEISPVAEDFLHFIKRDEKNLKNMLMKSGLVLTKQLSMLHRIETNSDRHTLARIIKALKNNDGEFEEENLNYLKKIVLMPSERRGSLNDSYRALPEIMESIKDENGLVDRNKYLNFKKLVVELKSLSAASKMQKVLSKYTPEKAKEIYSQILGIKINKNMNIGVLPDMANFVFDEKGNKNIERMNFVSDLASNNHIYGLGGAVFNMCAASDDNMDLIREIVKCASPTYPINFSGLNSVYTVYKDENNKLPPFIKENILTFAKRNISINYFIPLYAACSKQNTNTGETFFDTELFNKTLDFMSIEQSKTKNSGRLSPEIYIGIITNTLNIGELKFKDKVNVLNAVAAVDKYNTENNIKGFEFLSKMITEINDSLSVTNNYMPISEECKDDFIKNTLFSTNRKELTPFEKVISNSIPKLEKMADGLKIKYSRKDFLQDLSKICENNPAAEDIIKQKTGIEFIFDNETSSNITGYNGLIHLNELNVNNRTEKQIYDCMYKFMYENEVQTGDSDLDAELNRIIKAFPEFINTIGKKQHGTQMYTLDIHQLLVMAYAINNSEYLNGLNANDKAVLKLSALFHDIMKQENVVDTGHQYPSSLYAKSIIQKVVKNPENIDRIYEMINNHHWLAAYANSKDKETMAKELAFKFRRPDDFEVAKIMADADLKAVSNEFYSKHKAALKDESIDFIEDSLYEIYTNGNALFTDYIVLPSKLNNHIETKDGKEYKVINFHNIKAKEDLSEYGFDSGVTKDSVQFLVHMVDENKIYNNLNTVKMLASPINGGVLSESLITPKYNRTYCNRKYGVLLSHINTNIINEDKNNQGSGREKDMSNIMSLVYNYPHTRQNFRNELLKALGINPDDISDEDYADFYKYVLASKTSLNQINPDKKYNLGNNSFTGKDLIGAIKYYQDSLIDKTESKHNEIVGYIPKIHGLVAKAKNISFVPDDLLKFAHENDLPIILI